MKYYKIIFVVKKSKDLGGWALKSLCGHCLRAIIVEYNIASSNRGNNLTIQLVFFLDGRITKIVTSREGTIEAFGFLHHTVR